MESEEVRWLPFGIDAGTGLIFLACALWSYKKPAAAFMTALVLYILIHVMNAFYEPASIVSGGFIKILVIIALAKACKEVRDNEEFKKSLGG